MIALILFGLHFSIQLQADDRKIQFVIDLDETLIFTDVRKLSEEKKKDLERAGSVVSGGKKVYRLAHGAREFVLSLANIDTHEVEIGVFSAYANPVRNTEVSANMWRVFRWGYSSPFAFVWSEDRTKFVGASNTPYYWNAQPEHTIFLGETKKDLKSIPNSQNAVSILIDDSPGNMLRGQEKSLVWVRNQTVEGELIRVRGLIDLAIETAEKKNIPLLEALWKLQWLTHSDGRLEYNQRLAEHPELYLRGLARFREVNSRFQPLVAHLEPVSTPLFDRKSPGPVVFPKAIPPVFTPPPFALPSIPAMAPNKALPPLFNPALSVAISREERKEMEAKYVMLNLIDVPFAKVEPVGELGRVNIPAGVRGSEWLRYWSNIGRPLGVPEMAGLIRLLNTLVTNGIYIEQLRPQDTLWNGKEWVIVKCGSITNLPPEEIVERYLVRIGRRWGIDLPVSAPVLRPEPTPVAHVVSTRPLDQAPKEIPNPTASLMAPPSLVPAPMASALSPARPLLPIKAEIGPPLAPIPAPAAKWESIPHPPRLLADAPRAGLRQPQISNPDRSLASKAMTPTVLTPVPESSHRECSKEIVKTGETSDEKEREKDKKKKKKKN